MKSADAGSLERLLARVRACRECADLPRGPRPVIQAGAGARLAIVGQAPGLKVHETGVPWNDASGERLRAWLGIPREVFYDPARVALVGMGFCYPGRGRSGDLPPRVECAPLWHARVFAQLRPGIPLVLVGAYAHAYYLRGRAKPRLAETVRAWRDYAPRYLVLPHPSPRNNLWLKAHPWFEAEALPELRRLALRALAAR